jgi:hypothetical protein
MSLKKRLEKTLAMWCEHLRAIERTHGESDPAAKAIECCIRDLRAAIEDLPPPP